MSCNPFLPAISEWTDNYQRNLISVYDKGNPKVKYVRQNDVGKAHNLFRIDGNIIKEGNRCDFLLLQCEDQNERGVAIFIEVKGSDLNHASLQVLSTITSLSAKLENYNKAARIVLRRNPVPEHRGNNYKRLVKFLGSKKEALIIKSQLIKEIV